MRLTWALSSATRGDSQETARVLLCILAPPAPCQVVYDSGILETQTQYVDLPSRVPANTKASWNVTVTSAVDGAAATAGATFVTGIEDVYNATTRGSQQQPGDWAGANWLQGLPATTYHSRARPRPTPPNTRILRRESRGCRHQSMCGDDVRQRAHACKERGDVGERGCVNCHTDVLAPACDDVSVRVSDTELASDEEFLCTGGGGGWQQQAN